MAMATGKSVPKAFLLKKKKLIQELSIPDEAYSDLSPKGSVDANIRELIDEVNAIEGLVTTSSCGGRISVFLEGKHTTSSDAAEVNDTSEGFRAVVPGGKGAGGRWLFVSHDPMLSENIDMTNVMDLFGISPPGSKKLSFAPSLCFIKLQFEPMVSNKISTR
jgi:tRNA wybutosine-synthesizing protein 3